MRRYNASFIFGEEFMVAILSFAAGFAFMVGFIWLTWVFQRSAMLSALKKYEKWKLKNAEKEKQLDA